MLKFSIQGRIKITHAQPFILHIVRKTALFQEYLTYHFNFILAHCDYLHLL